MCMHAYKAGQKGSISLWCGAIYYKSISYTAYTTGVSCKECLKQMLEVTPDWKQAIERLNELSKIDTDIYDELEKLLCRDEMIKSNDL